MIARPDPVELAMQTRYNELAVVNHGTATGRLLGGCLSVLTSLVGTDFLPDLTGAVLFLEEVGEPVYKVDRYFSQLSHAGILSAVSGLLIGDFLDCEREDPESPSLALLDVIRHYVRDLDIPVVANFPYGHGDIKYTIPVGCTVLLDTEKNTIEMLEPGVK
jgi:muramoyltetrapeptide carboxypeptidase